MFDFSNLFNAMEDMFRVDYENRWITKDDLKTNVAQGVLSAEGYRKITGDTYAETTSGLA